jgi:uncharacterized RDD family membrane protein YckC
MEMAAAPLIIFAVLRVAPPRTGWEIAAVSLSLLAASILLLLGGAYWCGVLRRAGGKPALLRQVLRVADRAERPILALLAVAWLVSIGALAVEGWSRPVIAAFACSALAALEYVNYFQVQLQHFDHWADFQRLLTGRGFRPAHLGRDVAALRRGKQP